MWHALSTSSYGNWRIWFHSCINLLFVLYPVRHSLFRDVVILCHRSIGTSPCQSPSEFCTSHEMFLFWVFSSISPPCSDVEVFWRVFWGVFFFNASISNVYVFEFLGRKHSNFPLQLIFYALGNEKWYHLLNGPTYLSLS